VNATLGEAVLPEWVVRRATWLLIALHVVLVAQMPVYVILGFAAPRRHPVEAVVAAAAIGALQLRHSLATARGVRPVGWRWTLLLLVLLAYLPRLWFSWNWAAGQIFVIASVAMLLRGRLVAIGTGLTLGISAVDQGLSVVIVDHGSALQVAMLALYGVVIPGLFAAAIYGGARLVRLLDELYATRTELAEVAIGRERVRVSRDLHDLLGQSLSAISLKGDLAIRLLPQDEGAARTEIEGLTRVAREALRDVRAITRDEHQVSLRGEIDAAAALLAAAGIDARIDVDLPELTRPVQDTLAWAVREGTTNMLRHSEARTCSIAVVRRAGTVRLEMVNDGVRGRAAPGSGLTGLIARARAVSGSASAAATRDGLFRLRVDLPEVAV
jgi:two-component system sensor histidine kinase DesK